MAPIINTDVRHRRIFNLIAPVYSLLDGFVKKNFKKAIHAVKRSVELKDKSILDIGTGTGAWASLFLENGAKNVHGLDFAENMIRVANKRYSDFIRFSLADAENLNEFENESFDIVTASFVLHGVNEKKRIRILSEMKRLSKDLVIVHDYYGHTARFTRFLERLEKSDYIHFKNNFCNELSDVFPYVGREILSNGAAIYFGSKYKEIREFTSQKL